jgi:hypothetical protein
MNEFFWANATSDLTLTYGHQPNLHDGFGFAPPNGRQGSTDMAAQNIPPPIEPKWINPYAQNPFASHASSHPTSTAACSLLSDGQSEAR